MLQGGKASSSQKKSELIAFFIVRFRRCIVKALVHARSEAGHGGIKGSGNMTCGLKAGIVVARKRAALLGVAAISLLVSGAISVCAEEIRDQSVSRSQFADFIAKSIAFEIPAGELIIALEKWSDATGLKFVSAGDVLRGRQTTGLLGSYTAATSLTALLRGSNLQFGITGKRTVTIYDPQAALMAHAQAIALDTITVESTGESNSTLPSPYPGGQVARGARLGILGNVGIMNAPFNITSYTSKLIEDQQARNIVDVLANEPTAQAAGPWHFDNFYIRGFTVNREEIGFNGLYGIASTEGNLLEGIERVEVLKGASTLLTGAAPRGTAGGSINLVPKRAGDTPLTRLTTSYFSKENLGAHLDIGRRFGPDNAFGARFNLAYRNGAAPTDYENQEVGLFTGALDYRGERLRLSADFGVSKQDISGAKGNFFVSSPELPKAPPGQTSVWQPWEYQNKKNAFGVVRGDYDVTDNISIGVAYGASKSIRDTINTFPTLTDVNGNIDSPVYGLASDTETRSGEINARMRFETGAIKHNLVLAATDYKSNIWNFQPTINDSFKTNLYAPVLVGMPADARLDRPLTKLSDTNLRSYAAINTLSVLDDRIQLIVGARHQTIVANAFNWQTGAFESHYDESVVTPAAAIVIKPQESVSIYANYMEALSQGDTAPSTAVNANQVFAPFVSKQAEVGIKVDWGTIATTLSAFQITRPSGFLTADNVYVVDGEQRNRGLEFQVFGELKPGLRVLGGVAWTNAELAKTQGGLYDGNPAAVPEWQLKLGGEWDVAAVPGLTATGRIISTGSQPLNIANTIRVPSWTRVDLGARYETTIEGRRTVFRFMVENVADASYWDAVPAFQVLTYAMPRTYLLSASIDF